MLILICLLRPPHISQNAPDSLNRVIELTWAANCLFSNTTTRLSPMQFYMKLITMISMQCFLKVLKRDASLGLLLDIRGHHE